MGCETFGEIEHKLAAAIAKPIPPKHLNGSPTREVVMLGDDVDLFKLPIPMSSIYDGGPMITAGVVIAKDPEFGINSGVYRMIVKEKALTGIDIVTPNNMRLFAQRAFERKEPLPISISIGTHPFEITGSGYRAPLGVDEMAIAGGLRGEAVDLAPCSTIDMPYIADAEIVLEAEILPTGWTYPEGRFGEFTRLMGGLHWNPLVRIKAISMRKDAIYYNLHMPWENTWLAAPTRYTAIRQALKIANVNVTDINVTLGGCAFWHAVISIKKAPGDGKNALLAALSVMDLKHVVVVDDVFAKKYFGNQDPIGKRIVLEIKGGLAEIVGIVEHVNQWGLDSDGQQALRAELYFPYMQLPDEAMRLSANSTGAIVRFDGDGQGTAAAIRAGLKAMNGDQVMFSVQTMEEIIADSLAARRLSMIMLVVFAALAVGLASLGIYGVISYIVGQRTQEIGIRMALGARPGNVLAGVLGQGAKMVSFGVAIGLLSAFGLTRLMAKLLFGISATDPLTFAGVTAFLTLVALAACWIPARRAMRVDPIVALRYE